MSGTTDTPAVGPFDLTGPLPTGLTVLEASAGTGKTFAIAALATRFVAEGVAKLDDILAITFTRMATGELRERVRDRLVTTERALGEILDGGEATDRDEVVDLLASAPPEEIARRRRRLAAAVADFDAATITTTHGFCLEALASLGFAGDVAPDCAFVEGVEDLIDEVIDDLYVRRFQALPRAFGRDEAGEIVRLALRNPGAVLEPADAPDGSLAAMRVRLAQVARDELDRRKLAAQVMTYDDLLTRLESALRGPGGATVAERLRSRYSVVLVDEFQDTDPVQWSIMREAFVHDDATLVLIGDPKQAIYAFRGADVYAYLQAAGDAGSLATLATNWRSDGDLIRAYDALFAGAQLGHPQIAYRDVEPTRRNVEGRLHGAPDPAPLRIRVVEREAPTVGTTPGGYAKTQPAREHIADDLAFDVVGLLSSGAQIERRAPDGQTTRREAVRPGDIAVLVRRNVDAGLVRDTLERAGVPAVMGGAGSVFAGEAADEWLRLLDAIEQPASLARAHSVALTAFVGWDAERVACATGEEWETVHRRLHLWARVLRTRGVASLVEAIMVRERLPERVLRTRGGERVLTDLRHVGQLLHRAATDDHLGVAALAAWLRRRIADAAHDPDEERSVRLESDAAAVQILTIHRSKGLEFPIVYAPFLWTSTWIPREVKPIAFHDPDHEDRHALEVGLDGPQLRRHQDLHLEEQRGEDLRLAYVALTRACHQAVVWWAGAFDSKDSALGRLVFARGEDGAVPARGDSVPGDTTARDAFRAMAERAPGCVSVELSRFGSERHWDGAQRGGERSLSAAVFDRDVDRSWRRTSYSDMTAGAGHDDPRVASEPEAVRELDEPDDTPDLLATPEPPPAGAPSLDDEALRAVPSPLADMPGGTAIGSLVHDVMERTDFAADDLRGELRDRLAEVRTWRRVDLGDEEAVVAGLAAAIETPLGPVAGEVRLRHLARMDRIDEMSFELPLAGGDRPVGAPAAVSPAAIGAVLREHLPAGDPLHAYAERLDDPLLRGRVRGYLTGSIDLAFRVAGDDDRDRYAIVDYKTNRLGDRARPLTLWDHRPAAIREEMFRSHYALQGLLYTVALHRYLRWRVADHDPERDLLGVFYLFVRGMAGAETPRVDGAPCGVFAWRPPGAVVVALSDLLDRGEGSG